MPRDPAFLTVHAFVRRAGLALAALVGGLPAAVAGPPATIEGPVLYSDADWGMAFVHDGTGVRLVETGNRPAPTVGHAVRVSGATASVRGFAAVEMAGLVDLGPARPPAAVALGSPPSAIEAVLRWVSCDAIVRETRGDLRRSALRVAVGPQQLDVVVPVARSDVPRPLRGTRMRFTGVLEPPVDPWSRPTLWVAGWEAAAVVEPAPAASALPVSHVRDIVALWQRGGSERELRVQVRAVGRGSLRSLEVEDGSGRITAELDAEDTVNEGARYDLRAFLATRRGRPVLVDARWRVIQPDWEPPRPKASPPRALPQLTSAAAIRALTRADAERGLPIRLRAVVTYSEPDDNALFVQDETGAVYVHDRYRDSGLRAGDLVLVEGRSAAGSLAAVVADPRFTRLGRGELPAARPTSAERLLSGEDDCRRVEIEGVVRSVRLRRGRVEMALAAEGRRLLVAAPASAGLLPAGAVVDARVRVRAVCGSRFNWRGQLSGVLLYVPRAGDLELREAPPPPSALPVTAVRDLLRASGEKPWGRRSRVRAVVLKHHAGQPLYLRDGTGTLVVTADAVPPLVPGDRVDVAGFSAPSPFAPRLEDAVVRVIGHGPSPVPTVADAAALLAGQHEGDLVRLEATLLNVLRRADDSGLLLRAGEVVVLARGDGDLPPSLVIEPGSRLRVDGVPLVAAGPDEEPVLQLTLRTPSDVRVLSRPAWWTPARAAWAVAALCVVLLVSFAWASALRRQVGRQTEALRRSEERYRLLAENASDVIVTLDRTGRLTYASPSIERRTGYTAEEALRLSLDKLLAPESWRHVQQAVERAGTGETPAAGGITLEIETVHKDGSRAWNEVRGSVLRDAAGRRVGYLGVARDVTLRRRAQQERARLAAAVEQAAETVMLTDEDGTIRYVNPAFERITGYSSAEVVGARPGLLKSGVHDRPFYDGLWATLRAGRSWEGRFTNRRKDGELFVEDASISPIREPDGRTIGYVAVKRDVTRQSQIEAYLAQVQKLEAMGRLAAGVAHDFNNLLAAILGFADLLVRKISEQRALAYVTGIRDAAMRGAALTRQILAFSRQSPAELRAVDVQPLVLEAAELLRAALPSGVEVRVREPGCHALVTADPNEIHQVVVNLGTNGGLAMRERGGRLEFALEEVAVDAAFAERHPPARPGRYLKLTVADSGCGMTPEVLQRMYEPFYTTRGRGEGTGMGLAVVHGIVHRHGGVITAESEPGRGSTFSVFLPIAADPPQPDAVAGAPTPAGASVAVAAPPSRPPEHGAA